MHAVRAIYRYISEITFGRLFGVGLLFTPLVEPSRLLAACVAVRFQIIDSRHHLIHTSAPRSFLVSTRCDQQSVNRMEKWRRV